jgi:hypothetical protein
MGIGIALVSRRGHTMKLARRTFLQFAGAGCHSRVSTHRKGAGLSVAAYHHDRAVRCGPWPRRVSTRTSPPSPPRPEEAHPCVAAGKAYSRALNSRRHSLATLSALASGSSSHSGSLNSPFNSWPRRVQARSSTVRTLGRDRPMLRSRWIRRRRRRRAHIHPGKIGAPSMAHDSLGRPRRRRSTM